MGENSFWRSYIPANFGETGEISLIGGELSVRMIDILGANPTAMISLNAYTTDDIFPNGALTLITTATIEVTLVDDLSITPFTFDSPVTISATDEIVIEMAVSEGQTEGFDLRLGENLDGESAPTYFSTPECGSLSITSFDDLGFPGHGILNLVVDDLLSTANNALSNITSVFPNPTNGDLNIAFDTNVGRANVQITNVNGQIVMNDTIEGIGTSIISTSDLTTGAYFAKITTDSATTVVQFVKN